MAIALPIIVEEQLTGTCFVGGQVGDKLLIVSTLHHLGKGKSFKIGLPLHGGDMSRPQVYPTQSINTIEAEMVYADPITDISILKTKSNELKSPIPRFALHQDVRVGDEMIVLGYPYAPIGSILETAENCSVSALGQRIFLNTILIPELILAHYTHTGSSGSPLIRKRDGLVCGMIRGCLAPPEVISIGNLPLGSDSNITYAISSDDIQKALKTITQ